MKSLHGVESLLYWFVERSDGYREWNDLPKKLSLVVRDSLRGPSDRYPQPVQLISSARNRNYLGEYVSESFSVVQVASVPN